ncbi:MAG: hypothetical protein II837_16995 [Treponema sp.]|nr:hypothetical protein [Treponema sp.]MBQ7165911.1 hypothetical protein [Treponema sp.]
MRRLNRTPEYIPVDAMRNFARAMVMSAVRDMMKGTGNRYWSARQFLSGKYATPIYELCDSFVIFPDVDRIILARRGEPSLHEDDLITSKKAAGIAGCEVKFAQEWFCRRHHGKRSHGVARIWTDEDVAALRRAWDRLTRRRKRHGQVRNYVRSHPGLSSPRIAEMATRDLGFVVTAAMVRGHILSMRKEQ